MVPALLVKGQEQVEEWDVVWGGVGEGWEEIVPELVPVEIVFAPVVGRRLLTRQAHPVTT
jgi:hypothetical protein